MGLAILMIYIPTFLVTSIVSIFIGRLIVKIIRRAKTEETIENKKKIAYIIGTTTVILTISIAWWCTKIDWDGIGFITIPITISLFLPPIIGLLITLTALVLRTTGFKNQAYFLFYIASSAFQTTVIIPIFCAITYAFYNAINDILHSIMTTS
ncbi:hypothetical protein ABCS64_03965 [Rhodocyclaceae bacterium Wk13]|uniref:G-protein coupled receptors family 1 profile domain-containing protein n=2 Tax=Dentiradicibacter hellwigii TaxID=3149053 RepID=A0ABV4UE42_9RHOO